MLPKWALYLPLKEITSQADRLGLETALLASVVQKESGGRVWAPRFEPHYKFLNEPAAWAKRLNISTETEEVLQKISWGAMQVMGATARDEGFRGHLPELCQLELGLHFGGRFLRSKLRKYGNIREAVAAYNAGRAECDVNACKNDSYVKDVLGFYQEFTLAK